MGSFGSSIPAQVTGSWLPGFDHNIAVTTPPSEVANDFERPFRDILDISSTPPAGDYLPSPTPPALGASATSNFFWGQGNNSPQHRRPFNAIHMSLIPKGPHRGKVLVWGGYFPVRLRPDSTVSAPAQYWYCQAWSIIDPAWTGQSGTFRFRNYLLPLASSTDVPPPPPGSPPGTPQPLATDVISDIFCTGHTWTQDGDLVVAGGAQLEMNMTTIPPVAQGGPLGANWLFHFDPSGLSQPFGVRPNLYPESWGSGPG